MISEINAFLQVIVGSRHRHSHGILQRSLVPLLGKAFPVVQLEVPYAA